LIATTAAADVEKARTLFGEGIRLFKKGDWEGARRLFREADAEHHAPAIVYNLGLAEEKLGHFQAAVDAFEAYIGESGESGEFSITAAAAIAQLKARSTRLRLETRPPGAKLFVDGAALREPAPATLLVPPGHHVVVAQGEDWRAEREIETAGTGDVMGIVLVPQERAPAPAPAPAPIPTSTRPADADRPVAPSPPPVGPRAGSEQPEGFVWGAAFAAVPAYMFGVTSSGAANRSPAWSVAAGPLLEVGAALTDRFEFLGRAFIGFGPDRKPVAYAYMGGPGLSYRVIDRLWLGATFIFGQFETEAHGDRYGTDIVFGVMSEANAVLLKKPDGEWFAGFQPAFLLTKIHNDNTTIFFPLTFGYRAY
jgi:hypothetical protein